MRFNLQSASRRRRQAAAAGVLLAASSLLAACGGATVSNEPSSIAPLTRSATASASSSTSASSQASSSSQSGSASASAQSSEPNLDQGQQISAIPQASDNRTDKEKAYLDKLTADGINIAGVEDQMLGAAGVVCQGQNDQLTPATIQAIAGQLVQQGRTTAAFDQVVSTIESAAKSAYC